MFFIFFSLFIFLGHPNQAVVTSRDNSYYSDHYNVTWSVRSFSEITDYRISYRKAIVSKNNNTKSYNFGQNKANLYENLLKKYLREIIPILSIIYLIPWSHCLYEIAIRFNIRDGKCQEVLFLELLLTS